MRHYNETVTLERPADPPAKREAALEEVEGVLGDGPDTKLPKLRPIFRFLGQRCAIGRTVAIRLTIPDRRSRQSITRRVVIHDRESCAGRAVACSQGVVKSSSMPAPSNA